MLNTPITKKLSAILLEDDMVARLTLENFCQHYPGLELKAEFEDLPQAVEYVKAHPVDIIFLDVQLRSSNGFDLLQYLSPDTRVIVTTADEENCSVARAHQVADCLIKPISLESFQKSISNLRIPTKDLI